MRKILIIDGEEQFVQMAVPFLQSQNFQVEFAYTPEEAWEKIIQFSPDLILLSRDLKTDSGNLIPEGFAVLKELRTQRRFKKIPVIFLVSQAQEKDLERLKKLKYKADDYARKPIEDNDLLRRIENLIGFDLKEMKEELKAGEKKLWGLESGKDSFSQVISQQLDQLFNQLDLELKSFEQVPSSLPTSQEAKIDYLQAKLTAQKEAFERAHQKWKKALLAMEEQVKKLEQEKKALEEKVVQATTKPGSVSQGHLDQAIEGLERLEKLLGDFFAQLQNQIQNLKQLIKGETEQGKGTEFGRKRGKK